MDDQLVVTHTSKQKKSLRQALRKILFKGRRQSPEDVANIVGSGILRRDPSLCALPLPNPIPYTPSVLARFERYGYEDAIPDRFGSVSVIDQFDISSLASAVSSAPFLKPQLSMSSFTTLRPSSVEPPFLPQSVPQHHAIPDLVPSYYREGFSDRGSLQSLSRRVSTLRIQKSVQSLKSEPRPVSIREQPRRSLMRKKTSVAQVRQTIPDPSPDQQSQSSRSTVSSVRFADLPSLSPTSSTFSDRPKNQPIRHFSSFCILDTSRDQCPVAATSKDLRYIFEIGEEFCLNNRGCEGVSMDMVTGWDAAGNPITHLVLFSPLVTPSSGRSRFMLASLVDVTDFINDTASLPELETISEESCDEPDEIPTPTFKPRLHSALKSPLKEVHYALSAENLLGGCFLDDPTDLHHAFAGEDDIWINLATEEKKRSVGRRTPSMTSSASSSIDEILHDFMSNLQELYSDFFMLAKSPFDDDYYEICNVSPRIYDSKDYIHGHLSRTSGNDMVELSVRLAYDEPFTMLVRWGSQGLLRQLYCIPLFARVSTTWACFLVDASLPRLWR